MEDILGEALPPPLELEQRLANGVYLCQVGMKLLPDDPSWKKVEDGERERERERKREREEIEESIAATVLISF